MLKSLVASHIKISVATNAPTQFALRMLEHLRVKNLFDMIIGADLVNHSKPSPEMLNNILNYYSFDEKNHKAWMVGDNSKDILSAASAGIESIFVTWGFSPQSSAKIVVKKPTIVVFLLVFESIL